MGRVGPALRRGRSCGPISAGALSAPGQWGRIPWAGLKQHCDASRWCILYLELPFGFVFVSLLAEVRFYFIQMGCLLLPTKCRHFKVPIKMKFMSRSTFACFSISVPLQFCCFVYLFCF